MNFNWSKNPACPCFVALELVSNPKRQLHSILVAAHYAYYSCSSGTVFATPQAIAIPKGTTTPKAQKVAMYQSGQ